MAEPVRNLEYQKSLGTTFLERQAKAQVKIDSRSPPRGRESFSPPKSKFLSKSTEEPFRQKEARLSVKELQINKRQGSIGRQATNVYKALVSECTYSLIAVLTHIFNILHISGHELNCDRHVLMHHKYLLIQLLDNLHSRSYFQFTVSCQRFDSNLLLILTSDKLEQKTLVRDVQRIELFSKLLEKESDEAYCERLISKL